MIIKKKNDKTKNKKYVLMLTYISIVLASLFIGIIFSNEFHSIYDQITSFVIFNSMSTDLSKGLIVYYDFNELNNNIVYDKTLNYKNGLIQKVTLERGKQGYGLNFNGYDSYVSIDEIDCFDGEKNITISFWFKANKWVNSGEIHSLLWSKGYAKNYCRLRDLADFYCSLFINGSKQEVWSDGIQGYDTETLSLDEWYHVALTYDNSKIKLYLNGLLKDIKEVSGNISSEDILLISNYRGLSFNGTIDEFRIYNRALSENEVKEIYTIFKNALFENLFNNKIVENQKNLIINISEENYQKLSDKREEALTKGILVTADNDLVDADIIYNNKTIKTKIRLKGDLPDHFNTDKWSFRVEVQDNDNLLGMKRFSLQAPERRGINEWVYYKILKKEGLIALRYIFVNLTVNNQLLGEYVIEEHFGKELIENNQRTEGPIIKINEDIAWEENKEYLNVSDIDSYRINTILKDPKKYDEFIIGRELLDLLRKGNLSLSQVFDINQLGTFTAIIDVMGAEHCYDVVNRRFYYNPITSLLEPLPFDGNAREKITRLIYNSNHARNYGLLIKDLNFLKRYFNELERLSQPNYLENFIKTIPEGITYSEEILISNRDFIQEKLNPKTAIQVYANNYSDGILTLAIGNLQSLPIEILNLNYEGVKITEYENKTDILWEHEPNTFVDYKEYQFKMPQGFEYDYKEVQKLSVNHKILGTNKIMNKIIFPYPQRKENFLETDLMRQPPNTQEFEFLEKNDENKTITIKQGFHILNKTLITPHDYALYCNQETTINLINNSKIITHSEIIFQGPINIISTDGTGQGITILQANNQSIFNNVIFNNLSTPNQAGWELTGAITFYESPVIINNSQFLNTKAEDALNIKRSEFEIINSTFENSTSDFFDGDFVQGNITNSFFINGGGDGIDTSGSFISINNTKLINLKDKAVSIGERSTAEIHNIKIDLVFIGVASKDLSEVQINQSTIENANYSLALYQKKPEYGPSVINSNNNIFENNYIIEEGSNLSINSININNKTQNVFDLLYISNNVVR